MKSSFHPINNKKGKIPFVIAFIISSASISQAQNSAPESLTAPFIAYSQKNIQEKIYVHTDKTLYQAGEISWFKVYTVDASYHKPLDLSKIAYIEMLDSNNTSVLQAKIPLDSGNGNGSFFLPLNMSSGNYRFRAYTNWMKNFSPEFYFQKIITVINTKDQYIAPDPEKEKYDIRFFPEGGNLVNNIPGKMAFKVVDGYGHGTDCTGYLTDEQQDTLLTFQPLKFGLGNFTFTPASGHTYKAIFRFPSGTSLSKDLPAINNDGYVMSLSRQNTQIKVSVRSAHTGPVYLLALTRGIMKSAQSATLNNGVAEFIIDEGKLGEGISQFTIFNSARQPLCERLYFKYPGNRLDIKIQSDQQNYGSRKRMSLDVLSEDESGKLTPADMSIAVYRLDSLQHIEGNNISNYLWLSSDLPGRIESPEYYFSNEADPLRDAAMDNLMLTEGWRRFDWENIRSGTKPAFTFIPEYYGHLIIGKITDSKTGAPGKGIGGYLSVPGIRTLFRNATSDSSGIIKFEMKNFYGNELIAQTSSVLDSNYTIEIMSPFSTAHSSLRLPSFSLPAKNPVSLLDQSISAQVQHIYTSDRQNKFNEYISDTLPFYHQPDVRYILDNYTRFTTFEEVFREFVRNIFVTRPRGQYHLAIFQEASQSTFNDEPLVLLDGVPIFKTNKVMQYDPLKVKILDVIARKYFLGNAIYSGIINLVTYNGALEGYELDKNAIVLDYEGLQLQREFYAPEYTTPQQAASRLPDYRNVLYWSPSLKTGIDGKQKIELYTSDLGGKYAIVVQGITKDGRAGSQTITIEVKAEN